MKLTGSHLALARKKKKVIITEQIKTPMLKVYMQNSQVILDFLLTIIRKLYKKLGKNIICT